MKYRDSNINNPIKAHSMEQPHLSVFKCVGHRAKKLYIMAKAWPHLFHRLGRLCLPQKGPARFDLRGHIQCLTSRAGWQRGTRESSLGTSVSIQLLKPEFNLKLLWKMQYLKQT